MKKSIHHSNEAQFSHKSHLENSDKLLEQQGAKEGRILGLDFGMAKIGLAIADFETKIAFSFETLKNDKNMLNSLKQIVQTENVITIVLGMTAHEKDEKSAEEKMRFAQLLEKEFDIPIAFQEEMFSTRMAHANIKERGAKHVAQYDDAEAARIILQSWLDRAN